MDRGSAGAVCVGFAVDKLGNTTLGSCTHEFSKLGTLVSVPISGDTRAGVTEGREMLCNVARSSNSCNRIGAGKTPVRFDFLIACKKSLIAAINISFVSGGGGVTSVSGNQATVSVTRGEDVEVTCT
jgi:hypothetical protein